MVYNYLHMVFSFCILVRTRKSYFTHLLVLISKSHASDTYRGLREFWTSFLLLIGPLGGGV